MAVKNRALTIATRGLLSAAAVTIATHGLIQLPTGEAPPVAIPEIAQGGGLRAPGEVFRLEYARRHEHLSVLDVEFFGGATFDHVHTVPAEYSHRSALDLYMWGDGTAHTAALYTARSSLTVTILSGTEAGENHVLVVPTSGALELTGDHYLRVTHPGYFDHANDNAMVLDSGAWYQFTPAVVDDRIIPSVYTYTGDHSVELTGAASIERTPAPPEHYRHEGEWLLMLEGAGDVKFLREDTIEWTAYDYTASDELVGTFEGTATYAATTAQNVDARAGNTLSLAMYGHAAVTFRHGINLEPEAGNEDDDLLVLFAQMMSHEG